MPTSDCRTYSSTTAGMVRVLHTLSPIGVAMAGAGEFDHYED